MSRVCVVFKSSSVMCYFIAADISDSILSMFQVIVVDLVIT